MWKEEAAVSEWELRRTSVVGAGAVGGRGRLNLVELTQEEAAQTRELTHGTLCLG